MHKPYQGIAKILLTVGLIFNLTIAVYDYHKAGIFYRSDSLGYDGLAINLLQHHVFSLSATPPFEPSAFFAPGYSTLVATIYGLLGEVRYDAIIVPQMLLSLGTIFGIWYGLRRLHAVHYGAGLAAVLLGAQWQLAELVSDFRPDILFTFLLTLSAVSVMFSLRNRRIWLTAVAGLLTGLTLLTKVNAKYVPVLWVPAFIATYRSSPREALRHCSVYFGMVILVISPWVLRNYVHFGRPLLGTIEDLSIAWFAAGVKQVRTGIDFWTTVTQWQKEAAAITHSSAIEPLAAAYQRRVALNEILSYPSLAATTIIRGAVALVLTVHGWSDKCNLGELWAAHGALSFPMALMRDPGAAACRFNLIQLYKWVSLYVLYALALVGAVLLVKRRQWTDLLVWGLLAVFLIASSGVAQVLPGVNFLDLYTGHHARYLDLRYRVPAMPAFAWLAAFGVEALITRLCRFKLRPPI